MTASSVTALERYNWAATYINSLIQRPPSPRPGASADEIRARAMARIDRLRQFLDVLGNPQQHYRVAHIAGTSGKGSTAAFLASILQAAGYRTGLHISPYLQVETEKLQINGRLLSGKRFADYVTTLDAAMQRWAGESGEPLTYGEFWVALTLYAFAQEAVDVAVVEVGAGGRFDLTNILDPEVAVITSVGLDHMRTLGDSIPEIAWHKAGIIKPQRPIITTVSDPEALAVIRQEAAEQQAPLTHLVEGQDFATGRVDTTGTELLDLRSGSTFSLPLTGQFQTANAAAAIAAVRALPSLPAGPIDDATIRAGLAATRFPGRMEIVQDTPRVVLDGAHNPDKMRSLIASVGLLGKPARRIVIFGCLDGHDFHAMAEMVAPIADEVIVTSPSAYQRGVASPEELAETIAATGRPVEVIATPAEAIEVALTRATPEDEIVVTGSLYLVGAIRERWYRSDDIVVAQSSWPTAGESA